MLGLPLVGRLTPMRGHPLQWPVAASVATNGDEVLVLDRAHVSKREFNQRLRATRGSHKLDLKSFRFIHLNHCAQIATTKAVFGQVALQNNCFERAGLHVPSSGNAVINRGKSSPCLTIQTPCRVNKSGKSHGRAEIQQPVPSRRHQPQIPSPLTPTLSPLRFASRGEGVVRTNSRESLA